MQIGKAVAEQVRLALVASKMLDADSRIGKAFEPKAKDFTLGLPKELADLEPAVIDLLCSYQIERHITRDRDGGPNRLRKGIKLTPEFKALFRSASGIGRRITRRRDWGAADEVRRDMRRFYWWPDARGSDRPG